MEKNKNQEIRTIMQIKNFQAFEYTNDENFILSNFSFTIYKNNQDSNFNYIIEKNNLPYLKLPTGYIVLKTILCGICSTDLNRKYLPFPLPQVLGHEILAESIDSDDSFKYVVEISDSCSAHKSNLTEISEIFCESNLSQHCPNRYVLGINMLLGGFSPYIIVPINSAIKYNKLIIPDYSAVLVEPLAAAFNAIYTSQIMDDFCIAIIGPKKLGALIIAGLNAYKKRKKLRLKITAVIRREALRDFCYKMGADFVINIKDENFVNIYEKYKNSKKKINSGNFEDFDKFPKKPFDLVLDTSGTESGFKLALNLASNEVHLKSTSGKEMCGLKNLTAMVVDEINLIKFDYNTFLVHILKNKSETQKIVGKNVIYVSPSIQDENFLNYLSYLKENENLYWCTFYSEKSLDLIDESIFIEKSNSIFENRLPRFDLCIVNGSNLQEVDKVIRPFENSQTSLIKPKGNILLYFPQDKYNFQIDNTCTNICNNYYNLKYTDIQNFILSNGIVTSSRCGDFRLTLDYLESDEQLREVIQNMITHVLPVEKIQEGFNLAKSEEAIKVILKHG
jgi:threonine dehydrogenase-like Zn-dependent dehydrogenase